MTNKYANWERLESVIRWANMTTNYFALHIGLSRGENLYHIKRGNYGISFDLADRIVSRFPEIDRTWLLTGVGTMLRSDEPTPCEVAHYDEEVEKLLLNLRQYKATTMTFPLSINGCNIVTHSYSRAMSDTICVDTKLFLKHVANIVQGNEYVLVLNDNRVIWRKVRHAKEEGKWRLVARNRDEFEDVIISDEDIRDRWRVIAKMAIMSS